MGPVPCSCRVFIRPVWLPNGSRTTDFRNMRDAAIPDEVRSWFNSIAYAQGWKCSSCGAMIQVEDREVYFRSGRCLRCESIDLRGYKRLHRHLGLAASTARAQSVPEQAAAILEKHCVQCHGEKMAMSGLRLLSSEQILQTIMPAAPHCGISTSAVKWYEESRTLGASQLA